MKVISYRMCMSGLFLHRWFSSKHHQERQELKLEELVKHHPQASGFSNRYPFLFLCNTCTVDMLYNIITFGDHNEQSNPRYIIAFQTSPDLCR